MSGASEERKCRPAAPCLFYIVYGSLQFDMLCEQLRDYCVFGLEYPYHSAYHHQNSRYLPLDLKNLPGDISRP